MAQTDTSGGVYGSITFTNSANTNGLKINGNTYTLIYSMSQLDLLDGGNSVTGMYYDPTTHSYDIPIGSRISDNISNYKNYRGTCSSGSGTCYWDPTTQLYDLSRAINTSIRRYYWDPTTGAYDIASYNTTS